MSANSLCHLIVDPPASGSWNMAVDEVLLESVAETNIPTLRIYQWGQPTLSLGYFQRYEDRQSHPASKDVDVVRRQSGGGAILHDQEITYSLIVPAGHPLVADPRSLYQTIHRGLIAWLNSFNVIEQGYRAELCAASPAVDNKQVEPFLCFQRRSNGDVILSNKKHNADHKIIGSAQRRRHGAVLQHGSILWSTSRFAQEFCGFANLIKSFMTVSEAQDRLVERLPELLGFEFECLDLSTATESKALQFQKDRYAQTAWTKRR